MRDCRVSRLLYIYFVAHIDVAAYAAARVQAGVRRALPVQLLKHICMSMLEHISL